MYKNMSINITTFPYKLVDMPEIDSVNIIYKNSTLNYFTILKQ